MSTGFMNHSLLLNCFYWKMDINLLHRLWIFWYWLDSVCLLLLVDQISISHEFSALLFVSYRSKDKKYWLTSFVSAAVVSYAFSLVKLLALSEVEIQLKYPGLWFSVGWSLIASATLGGLSYWFLARAHKNYEELLNEDDTEQGVSNNSEYSLKVK